MTKPEVDYIHGLPPAIAIEQKVVARNPRSTVGTSTEIYEYMRLLFARIGRTYSPISGQEVKKNSVEDIIACTHTYSDGTKFMVLAPFMSVRGARWRNRWRCTFRKRYGRVLFSGKRED